MSLSCTDFPMFYEGMKLMRNYYVIPKDSFTSVQSPFKIMRREIDELVKSKTVSQDAIQLYIMKEKLLNLIPEDLFLEEEYKELIKEKYLDCFSYQNNRITLSVTKVIHNRDGFYILINKKNRYLLAKAGNKFYTLQEIRSYTEFRKEREFLYESIATNCIMDGTKLIFPMYDLRKRYIEVKERRNVRQENLYNILDVNKISEW